jgi:hypothetical protein
VRVTSTIIYFNPPRHHDAANRPTHTPDPAETPDTSEVPHRLDTSDPPDTADPPAPVETLDTS